MTSESFSATLDEHKDKASPVEGSFPRLFEKMESSSTSSSSNSWADRPMLLPIIMGRFMKEMQSLFKTLPVNIQCSNLLRVMNATSCGVLMVQNWTTVNVTKCNWYKRREPPNQGCRRDAITNVFQQEMGWIFETLPQPFKCNIVNLAAQTYSSQSDVQIPVHEIERALQKLFHFVNFQHGCSKASPEVLLPPDQMVNLTVRLKTNMTKDIWLRNFKTKGPQLYKLYLLHQQKPDKPRMPLAGTGLGKPLVPEMPPCQIYIRNVSGGLQQFSVVFALNIKMKGQFRALRSIHKVVKSLKTAERTELESMFQAKVVQVKLKSHGSAVGPKGAISWTSDEMKKARNLFPKNMTDYFKQLSRLERCFILFQISSSLRRNPKVMEAFYNALKYIIRRRSCSQPARQTNGTFTIAPGDLTREIFLSTRASRPVRDPLTTSMSFTEGDDQLLGPDPGGDDSEDEMTSLEYALFILLGLLCLATLAFTINYALYTLKRSPIRTTQYLPNGTLPSQVVGEKGKREMVHCVHIKHNNCNIAKHEDCQRFVHVKGSSTTTKSGVLFGSDTCKVAEQFRKHATSVSANDSGYSQSPEASFQNPAPDLTADSNSHPAHCPQRFLNSRSEQPETNLDLKAETAEGNVKDPPDSDSKQNSDVLCSRSSDVCTHSSPRDSPTCSCTPSSQESSHKTVHIVLDHGSCIKEIQV